MPFTHLGTLALCSLLSSAGVHLPAGIEPGVPAAQ